MRINPITRAHEGRLARSRLIRNTESISPSSYAWIRTVEGEPAGDFLSTEEDEEGHFDDIESEPTWI